MKITVIPTGNAPEYYSFEGETITAYKAYLGESFDLSTVETGGKFVEAEVDTLDLPAGQIIRDVTRDELGELHVTLCQRTGPGHWLTGAEFDATEYAADKSHVIYNADKSHGGEPWVLTSTGKTTVGVV